MIFPVEEGRSKVGSNFENYTNSTMTLSNWQLHHLPFKAKVGYWHIQKLESEAGIIVVAATRRLPEGRYEVAFVIIGPEHTLCSPVGSKLFIGQDQDHNWFKVVANCESKELAELLDRSSYLSILLS